MERSTYFILTTLFFLNSLTYQDIVLAFLCLTYATIPPDHMDFLNSLTNRLMSLQRPPISPVIQTAAAQLLLEVGQLVVGDNLFNATCR